jgi:hypothetical protein
MILDIYRHIFEKSSNIKFNENPYIGSRELFHRDGQTDRHDKANSHFSQFCEHDKNSTASSAEVKDASRVTSASKHRVDFVFVKC